MADIQRTVEIIFSGQNRTSTAIVGIRDDLNGLSTTADRSTTSVQKTNAELDKIGGARAGINSATAALQALGASLVVKDFIDANVAIDQFLRVMTQVKGSTEGARQELDFIRDASNRLGIEVRGAADAYGKFAAAAKGTAAEGEPARIIFEAFAGTMASLGASSADTSGALTQLAQGVSKGKFELDDLKSVAERLPGFFITFSKALGITTEEFFDLVSQGKIGVPELVKVADVLKNNLGTIKFDSFNNELSRLKNSITETFVSIGDAGAFKLLIKAIEGATIVVAGSTSAFVLFGEAVGTSIAALTATASTLNDFIRGNITLAEAQKRNAANADLFKSAITESLDKAVKGVDGLVPKFLGLESATKNTTKASAGLAVALGAEEQAMLDQVKAAQELTTGKEKVKDKSAELARQQLAEKKLFLDTTKAAQDYAVKLEGIASNERIKIIESKVRLDIANAQADAQKVEAAFRSLSTTIESTGLVIGGAFGAIKDIDGFYGLEKLELIEKQLEKENGYRTEALQLQRDLTEAQIANVNARTQSLQRGNALVQIDGKGLQPHLEAFMWEILKTIQTRVNADGLELLVGA